MKAIFNNSSTPAEFIRQWEIAFILLVFDL